MTWQLTCATQADRDLVVATLRRASERCETAASDAALKLVVGTSDGRIGKKQLEAVRTFHGQAETLRVLAYELEQQPEVPLVTHDPAEEERAATYPPLAAVEEDPHNPYGSTNLTEVPEEARGRGQRRKPRGVKLVEYNPDTDPALQAAMAAHPSNGPQEET